MPEKGKLPSPIVKAWEAFVNIPAPLSREAELKLIGYLRKALIALLVLVCLARFVGFTLDFPPGLTVDGEPLTDEGLYANNAISYILEGQFYLEKDFNQAVTLPLHQIIQLVCFKIFGMSVAVARLIVIFSTFAYLAGVFLLVRRYTEGGTALVATTLLAVSHVLFAYSRLSLSEIPMAAMVVFSMVFASYAGPGVRGLVYTAISALLFTCGLLTKTNAVFAVPILALMIIHQERDWKRVLLKLAIASAVFFPIMAVYYVKMVKPRFDEYLYFYTLNVGVTGTAEPEAMVRNMLDIMKQAEIVEFFFVNVFPFFAIPLMLFFRSYRRHPLLLISIAWFLVYCFLYSTYGRFHTRFFLAAMAPIAIWAALTLKYLWQMRDRHWLPVYAFATIIILSTIYHLAYIGYYLSYRKDSYNQAAREIREIMVADPESNGLLLGHVASSVSLRNGIMFRNSRYSLTPIAERLEFHRPSYALLEGVARNYPLEPYYRHREFIEQAAHMEIIRTFDVLENYRHYPLVLYKLHYYEDEAPSQQREVAHEVASH